MVSLAAEIANFPERAPSAQKGSAVGASGRIVERRRRVLGGGADPVVQRLYPAEPRADPGAEGGAQAWLVVFWVTATGLRRRGSVNPWATMRVTVVLSGEGSVRLIIERHVSHLSL
jgi:hypothetical protein